MKTYDVIGFKAQGNTRLHALQYQYDGVEIAKHIIENKLTNQRRNLLKQRFRDDECNLAISDLKAAIDRLKSASTIQEIMGIEGSSAREYFKSEFNNCEWNGRQPRAKRDYINSTLDLAYTILFNYVESLLYYFGFDVYTGVLHREFYMRKSLVCDLVEPFRALMDQCVRNAISLGQCRVEDFELENGCYRLSWKLNKQYILFLIKPILANKDKMFIYVRDYYRAFAQSRRIEEYPVFEV